MSEHFKACSVILSYLGQLALSLPRAGERVKVAAMQLAGDIARDADARRRGAGIRPGARNVRCTVINGRDSGRGATTGGGIATITKGDVLDKAGEGHGVCMYVCVCVRLCLCEFALGRLEKKQLRAPIAGSNRVRCAYCEQVGSYRVLAADEREKKFDWDSRLRSN